MNTLYIKHRLVGTPLERVVRGVKDVLGFWKPLRYPELRELYREDGRIRRALTQIIQPDSNCIDVGCHIGSTLAHLCELAPRGEHYAFEAIEQKAAWLRRKFPHVHVKQLALSNTEGELNFHQSLSRPGFSGLGKGRNVKDEWKVITVPAARLDDVLPEDYRVDFMKVDVEGAEAMVFEGAKQTLARYRPTILFESVASAAKRCGFTHQTVFETLCGCGYDIFSPRDFLEGGEPADWTRFDASHRYPFQAFNYLARPSELRR